jgi:hypothetical protein
VLRAHAGDDRRALVHIALPDGAVRAQWLDAAEGDIYAHAFTDDGTLYTLTGDPGDVSGLVSYAPGSDRPTARVPWVFGVALLPAAVGLWALGIPRYAFRVSPGPATDFARDAQPCLDRADALAARANAAWDKQHTAWVRDRVASDQVTFNYHVDRSTLSTGSTPPPTDGVRGFENELFWETSYAAPHGDDVVVSDGVGVWRWRDDGTTIARTLLIDDVQRSTHRGARIIGLSVGADTLALLWKKDARGEKTVLSLFDLDR